LQRLPLRRIGGIPDAPLAITSTVSLVDMSPSMVMRLKLSSTHSSTALRSESVAKCASVVMKQSMVAMLGDIIPAPFTQPPRRTR
jgi:hypothetical protein